MLKTLLFASLQPSAFALNALFALSADRSLTPANANAQIAQRQYEPNQPLHLCHFSALSRTSRRHKMSIRRLLPCFPPVISAGNMRNVRNVQQNINLPEAVFNR
jgi:hypothetical protein